MRVCHSCVTRARSSASFCGAARASVGERVALRQQLGDRALGIEDALALHLGRVRGQHRRDVGCAPASAAIVGGADAGAAQPLERHRQRAFLQVRPARSWTVAPAHVVAVLGDVGQVREVAEGADHADRLVAATGSSAAGRARGRRWRRASAGRPPRAGARARPARRRPCLPARGSRRRGCGRAGGCPRPAAGSSRRHRRCRCGLARLARHRGSVECHGYGISAIVAEGLPMMAARTDAACDNAASDESAMRLVDRHARKPAGALAGRACARLLQHAFRARTVELLGMTTRGDQILDRSLSKVGGKGLFVKELETALEDGRADLAVHSLKDVPMDLPAGLRAGRGARARRPARRLRLEPRYAALADAAARARWSAPRACAAWCSCARCGPTCGSSRCAATSTRACASSTTASTTPSCWPPPA